MSRNAARRWALAGVMLLAAVVFLAGITWGLPSRAVDAYLFGTDPAWDGQTIHQLTGGRDFDPARGADIDTTPIPRDRLRWINQTPEQQARMVLRYRLYTYQPDEMITMMSLADMRPRQLQLDPRLYQYGGLWIYPVGALLQVASMSGLITLTTDPDYYLDHPEAFGRFYVVARLYTVAWALAGVWVVYWLTRRLTTGNAAPVVAAACFALLPVVVSMAHEAKPHMPGAVLMLMAVAAAVRYVERGTWRWAVATGALCGAAFGMVLSSLLVFAVLPVMVLLRAMPWRRRVETCAAGALAGVAAYFLTNPYVAINLVVNRAVLESNIRNSTEMYEIADWPAGLANATWLLVEGVSVGFAVMGLIGLAWLVAVRLAGRDSAAPAGAGSTMPGTGWLLAVPAMLIFLQFVALAAGKPGEYGRFGLFPGITLMLAAVVAIDRLILTPGLRYALFGLMILSGAVFSTGYIAGFLRDTTNASTRMVAARQIQAMLQQGHGSIGVPAEPAPFSVPPLDVRRWQIMLIPDDYDIGRDGPPADIIVRPVDIPRPLPPGEAEHYELITGTATGPAVLFQQVITWSDMPYEILVRRRLDP